MQRDAAAGTEFQLRQDEDAEHPEQSDADADDPTAASTGRKALTMKQVLTPPVELRVSEQRDAARLEVQTALERQALSL